MALTMVSYTSYQKDVANAVCSYDYFLILFNFGSVCSFTFRLNQKQELTWLN